MKHTIDFLFPIALFLVFASTSLIVLLCLANSYQDIVKTSSRSFETTTTLAYIMEKIHQNDSCEDQSISIDTIDGCDALTISQTIDGKVYHTYIYEFQGELKELFIQDGISASAEFGTTLLKIKHLEMEEISKGLFKFTCTSTDDSSDSVIVNARSFTP